MKKLLALLCAFFVTISLCACSIESVEEHDKKQSSSLAQASEAGAEASRDALDAEDGSSKTDENFDEETTTDPEAEKTTDVTSITSKKTASRSESNGNGSDGDSATTADVTDKQGSVYSYYVTEYETTYIKKTIAGTKSFSTQKGSTTSKTVGKTSAATTSKSSNRVNSGTSKSVSKANITVSQSKIDISDVLSNSNLSQSVKEKLESSNPYVKDYKMLVPSYSSVTVTEGSTVLDVLELVLETERKGSSDFAANPSATAGVRNSIYGKYVYSICGLAEKDCGSMSGWTYYVNGKMPSVSADKYVLKSGDKIEWVYVTG